MIEQSENRATTRPTTSTFRNLHVSLPVDISDTQLRSLFEPFGNIESVRVIREVTTARSLGYGFVQYSTVEEGCRAFGTLNGQTVTVGDRTFVLTISSSDVKHIVAETRKVYVCNIPSRSSASDVRLYFERFGSVIEYGERAQDIRDGPRQQRTRGAERNALVPKKQLSITYSTVEEARRAVEGCHGRVVFDGGDVPLMAKFAEERPSRRNGTAKQASASPPSLANTPLTRMSDTIPASAPTFSTTPMTFAQSGVSSSPFLSFQPPSSSGSGAMPRVVGLPNSHAMYVYFSGLLQRQDDGSLLPVRIDDYRMVDAVPMPVYVPVPVPAAGVSEVET